MLKLLRFYCYLFSDEFMYKTYGLTSWLGAAFIVFILMRFL